MIPATSLIGWTGIVCSASADSKVSFSSVSVPLTAFSPFLFMNLSHDHEMWVESDLLEGRKPASQSPELPVALPHCVLEIAAILLHVCVEFP